MTQEGAPSAVTRVRCRRRDCAPCAAAQRAARVVPIHDVKQRAFLRSRTAVLRAGSCCLFASSLRPLGHPGPRNEGAGGAPGGVLPVVALVGRDATLARRGASRAKPGPRLSALHRGVVGPGTAPDAPIPAIRPVGCSRPAIVHGGLRHRAFRIRGLRAAVAATPRSACWIVSGDAPHERGWRLYTTSSHRSQ